MLFAVWNLTAWSSKGHLLTNSSWSSAKAARRRIFPWDSQRNRGRSFNRIAEDIFAVRPRNSSFYLLRHLRSEPCKSITSPTTQVPLGEMARTKPYQVLGWRDRQTHGARNPSLSSPRNGEKERNRLSAQTGTRRR